MIFNFFFFEKGNNLWRIKIIHFFWVGGGQLGVSFYMGPQLNKFIAYKTLNLKPLALFIRLLVTFRERRGIHFICMIIELRSSQSGKVFLFSLLNLRVARTNVLETGNMQKIFAIKQTSVICMVACRTRMHGTTTNIILLFLVKMFGHVRHVPSNFFLSCFFGQKAN